MCGILGFATRDGAGPPADGIRHGLTFLHHRGPDAAQVVELVGGGARCVLGHTRLRILDVTDRADQPLGNEDESLSLAYNGEIYNFRELRAALIRRGHRFRSDGDSEVIVHLYEDVDGEANALLDRLRGMFAFALFDRRRGRLLLARDRWGIKPMYYARVAGGGIAFSSESRALVHAGLCRSEPDPAAIGSWLRRGVVSGTDSVFEAVRALRPGELLDWTPAGDEARRWWHPTSRTDPTLADPAEATQALAAALDDAVARHLVADRPVGIFLSDGLDSAAVARTASRHASRLRALTLACEEDPDPTVGRDAGATARSIGAEWTEVRVNGVEIARRLDAALRALDQPSWDGLNTWLVSTAAADHGFVVCLSGLGGDELFGGYPSFGQVCVLRRWSRMLHWLPRGLRGGVAAIATRHRPGGRVGRALDAGPTYADAWCAVRGLFANHEVRRLMGGAPVAMPRARTGPEPEPEGLPDRTRVGLLELRRYMADQLLRDTDSVSMANSLEVRLPLIDDVVSQVALAMPEAVRYSPGKITLARAAGVRVAPKRPFLLPIDAWLRGPLHERAREALLSDMLPFARVLPYAERARLWHAFVDRRMSAARVWALAVLRLWPVANGLSWAGT